MGCREASEPLTWGFRVLRPHRHCPSAAADHDNIRGNWRAVGGLAGAGCCTGWPSRTPAQISKLDLQVRLTANALLVRALSLVVPPVARVGTLMVVPAVVSTSIFGPVLAANGPRRAIGVVLGHKPMIPLAAGLSPLTLHSPRQVRGTARRIWRALR